MCVVRGQRRAPLYTDMLGQAELAKHGTDCSRTKPGSKRELQPARQPRIAPHAGGDEAEKLDLVFFLLWRLNDIQRIDGPRDAHHQRVGYPVENAKHKRKSRALFRELSE